MLEVPLIALLSVAGGGACTSDSLPELERVARASAYRYEVLLRRTTPERMGPLRAGPCDERIGRYCFWYPAPDAPPAPPPPPDTPELMDARAVAVREHRRWFAQAPHDPAAAGPLVRYLAAAGRAGEAVAAAGAHSWATDAAPQSLLLLGFALHQAGDFEAAEAAFDSARAVLAPADRRRLDDVGVLLEPGERREYQRLDPGGRGAYEARFWAFSDPSLRTAGNERRSAHYARHALGRVLALAPRVEGSMRWGSDDEEIVVRFGQATEYRRVREATTLGPTSIAMQERFSPYAVALVPPALLTRGLWERPVPGEASYLTRAGARSAYAPVRLRRMRGLSVQESVFPTAGGGVVRVDAMLRPDTADPRVVVRPGALLAMLDTLGREVARTEGPVRLRADSAAVFNAELEVPAGAYVLRVEIADDSVGLAGIAQYRVDVPERSGLAVSDLLLTGPMAGGAPSSRRDERLDPLPALTLPPVGAVGVYVEVSGLEPAAGGGMFEVESWLEEAEARGALHRALRRAGERLGLLSPERPGRVRWTEQSTAGQAALFFDVDLGRADPGLYRLSVTVRDGVSGVERTSVRLLRIVPPGAAP